MVLEGVGVIGCGGVGESCPEYIWGRERGAGLEGAGESLMARQTWVERVCSSYWQGDVLYFVGGGGGEQSLMIRGCGERGGVQACVCDARWGELENPGWLTGGAMVGWRKGEEWGWGRSGTLGVEKGGVVAQSL